MKDLISKRLKAARENKGLTQIQVMKLTHINHKTLSGYENNVSKPDLETLKILANLYDVSVDYLVGRTDNPAAMIIKEDKLPYVIEVDGNKYTREQILEKVRIADQVERLIRNAKWKPEEN